MLDVAVELVVEHTLRLPLARPCAPAPPATCGLVIGAVAGTGGARLVGSALRARLRVEGLGGLLAADGLVGRGVGLVGLGGLLDLIEVHIGRHLGAVVALAHQGREDLVDALDEALLEQAFERWVALSPARSSGSACSVSSAVLVDDLPPSACMRGTLDDTRCMMPATWSGDRMRPPRRFITDAVGRWSSRRKAVCLGIARWALETASIACTVRVSSPSSALVVHLLVELRDAQLLPVHELEAGRLPLGRPSAARRSRVSCTCACGTRMAWPVGDMR